MANTTTGLFQTLVAATDMAQQALKYQNAFVDAVWWETKPDPVQPYTGLNVIVPTVDESGVVDIGAGPLQPHDTNHTSVQIPFSMHFSDSFIIKTFDMARTPLYLKQKYMQPELEAVLRKVNRTIAQQVTAANFGSYTLISGAGADEIARVDITTAWYNLANAGAPVGDTGNVTLIESPLSFANQIGDSAFNYQYIVGTDAAVMAQQKAKLVTQYGAEVVWDQHLAKYAAGKEPGILMHRYAISGVSAPLIPMNSPHILETTGLLKDKLPYQIQMWPDPDNQGFKIHIHCWWGVKVTRPELGSLLQSA